MKKILFSILIMFLFLVPLLAQTGDQNSKTPGRINVDKDIEELHKLSELPEVIKKARDAGTEEEEIQKIVRGIEDKKLTVDEGKSTIKILEENTDQGKSNQGISDFVFQQKAKGIEGKDLGQSIKLELQQRHRIKHEENEQEIEKPKDEGKSEKEVKQEEMERQTGEDQKKEIPKDQDSKDQEKKSIETDNGAKKVKAENQSKKAIKKKADEDDRDPGSEDKDTK